MFKSLMLPMETLSTMNLTLPTETLARTFVPPTEMLGKLECPRTSPNRAPSDRNAPPTHRPIDLSARGFSCLRRRRVEDLNYSDGDAFKDLRASDGDLLKVFVVATETLSRSDCRASGGDDSKT